jgi:molecular chaperone DnaK (HSP70)
LTPDEVTTIFLRSLITSAEAFLGKKVRDAVITVPTWFSPAQRIALSKALSDTGVNVLQLLQEPGAAVATTTSESWESTLPPDRTQLLVDVGASSTTINLLSLRSGLATTLASQTTPNLGGDTIDSLLVSHFSTEFTKKTKIPLTVCPPTSPQDTRAEAKLRLALEHTKRTISASPGGATCSVESLKDGLDYTGSINRLRFDLVSRKVYTSISTSISTLLASAHLDPYQVDEIVYLGGTGSLPGLDEHILVSCGFHEDVETPFSRGTVVGGGIGDPTTILARGCALQAHLLSEISDSQLREAFKKDLGVVMKTVGVLLPSSSSSSHEDENDLGGTWIPVIYKETPLPARRAVRFDVELPPPPSPNQNQMVFEIWEVDENIRVEKFKPETDPEDEEEEEEEIKSNQTTKLNLLGVVRMQAKLGLTPHPPPKSKSADQEGRTTTTTTTTVDVLFTLSIKAELNVRITETGGRDDGVEGAVGELVVPAPGV